MQSIRAVVAGGGKQLFEQFADPRVAVIPAGEAASCELIVIPCPTAWILELPDPGLPDALWGEAAAGRAVVVFDASAEGREHTPQRTQVLHGLLAAKSLAPSRAVYLTQERNYRADYRAHCAAAGLEPMAVIEHDYWIWRFEAQFAKTGKIVLRERLADFQARASARERRFISLNFTPRPTKALFLLSLIRDGLWEQGFISFGGFDRFERATGQDRTAFTRVMLRHPGFEDLARELEPLIGELDAYGQVLLGKVNREEGGHVAKSPLLDRKMTEFDRSWFSVVTETEMRARVSRITEKPLKPLVNFHPLITFGNPGALAMLRELGFATFEEAIDERYDAEPDPRRRFEMAYAEVRRLCALDEAALARMEATLAPRLEHNARWGLYELPRARRAAHDAALIDRILASGTGYLSPLSMPPASGG
jgi:hypothetical protein